MLLKKQARVSFFQLKIWYGGGHVSPSILNLFLTGDEDERGQESMTDRPTDQRNNQQQSDMRVYW